MKTVDRLIEERGLSVAELAERAQLGLDRTAAIADGRWTPTPEERIKLAAAFGLAVTEISWGHTMNPRNINYHRKGMKENF